ncbi:MAG: bacterial ammonia monooxygenase, subunit AmoC [Thiotrichaceae bacterium]
MLENNESETVSENGLKQMKYYLQHGRNLAIGIAITLAIYLFAIWYQFTYAHLYGLDAHDPLFDKYWMTWFYTEITLEVLIATCLWGYLWITRDRHINDINPNEEIRRYFTFALYLAMYAWTLYWGVSYFTEQDGAWHQVVTRDTSFTPSHIMIFYLSFPMYIIIGVASLLYAYTRLPVYQQEGISLPHIILVTGPFMILPNVGLNEWGHAFWFMEEFFSAPLHWGFVILGWCGLALFGVHLQIVRRVSELLNDIEDQDEGENVNEK